MSSRMAAKKKKKVKAIYKIKNKLLTAERNGVVAGEKKSKRNEEKSEKG